jgi:hypothetical protein
MPEKAEKPAVEKAILYQKKPKSVVESGLVSRTTIGRHGSTPISARGKSTDSLTRAKPVFACFCVRIVSRFRCQTPYFFAQEHENHVFCYANANLTRDEQHGEVLRFVDFWNALTGHNPEWLYFDSKLTTYAELSRLNERGVYFATIRRRIYFLGFFGMKST